MEFLKSPLFTGIVITVSAVVAYMANTGGVFGKFISNFLPCTPDPAASFPCYGGYDVAILIVSAVVGLLFAARLAYMFIAKLH